MSLRERGAVLRDGWRLALGTLSVVRVAPPTLVDHRTASAAMALTPVVGLLLALPLAGGLALAASTGIGASPLLQACLVLGGLALLTRAIHLDGLADTADGLGSGRTGDAALAIMRRSDTGPFAVVTLVLVLLVQAACLAEAVEEGRGALALVAALVVGRGTLAVLCLPTFPPARRDGLGVGVAGSVGPVALTVAAASLVAVVAGLLTIGAALGGEGASYGLGVGSVPVHAAGLALAPLAGVGLALRARRRLHGTTGDVLGAGVEVSTTAALLAAALA